MVIIGYILLSIGCIGILAGELILLGLALKRSLFDVSDPVARVFLPEPKSNCQTARDSATRDFSWLLWLSTDWYQFPW
jgi:hypothetical protein